MLKCYFSFGLLFVNVFLFAQRVQVFTTADFDLVGKVKTCELQTAYGKELFEFDSIGRLVKQVTRFDESDYVYNAYTFSGQQLKEKRQEVYKEGSLDAATSMAHIFNYDKPNQIVEIIVSYDKKNKQSKVHYLDSLGHTTRIKYQHNNAVDDYQYHTINIKKGLKKEIEILNADTLRVETTKIITEKNKTIKTQIITIEYLDGRPYEEIELWFNPQNLPLQKIYRIPVAGDATPTTRVENYIYSPNKLLKEIQIAQENVRKKEGFIFMLDGHKPSNWVKKIKTPQNEYETRVITYYN